MKGLPLAVACRRTRIVPTIRLPSYCVHRFVHFHLLYQHRATHDSSPANQPLYMDILSILQNSWQLCLSLCNIRFNYWPLSFPIPCKAPLQGRACIPALPYNRSQRRNLNLISVSSVIWSQSEFSYLYAKTYNLLPSRLLRLRQKIWA